MKGTNKTSLINRAECAALSRSLAENGESENAASLVSTVFLCVTHASTVSRILAQRLLASLKVYFTSRSGEWKRSRSTPGVSAATRDFAIRRGTTIVSPQYSLN